MTVLDEPAFRKSPGLRFVTDVLNSVDVVEGIIYPVTQCLKRYTHPVDKAPELCSNPANSGPTRRRFYWLDGLLDYREEVLSTRSFKSRQRQSDFCASLIIELTNCARIGQRVCLTVYRGKYLSRVGVQFVRPNIHHGIDSTADMYAR